MANAFYSNMKATADRLLAQYGFDIQLLDANKTVLGTFKGLAGDITEDTSAGIYVKNGDKLIYVTFISVEPTMDNYVNFDNQIYKIVAIHPVKPTDTGIMYKIVISNGA